MNLQWYPGHMQKTKRLILEHLKRIDVVIEIVDARIPISSKNPDLDELLNNKNRILVFNKCDMADESANKLWYDYYKGKDIPVVFTNSKTGAGVDRIFSSVIQSLQEKRQRDLEKGQTRSIKMMIVGIPNVGKSTLINRLSGRASAKTGDRPGVTTGQQWVRLKNGFELLDTPGILWPKFESETVGRHLAFTGAIKDEIMDVEELCFYLIDLLKEKYSGLLAERYSLPILSTSDTMKIIEAIAKKRGAIRSGSQIDMMRISSIILDEFRAAKIGRITLEYPLQEDGQ